MSMLQNPTLRQILRVNAIYERVALYNIHGNEFYAGDVLGAFDLPDFILNEHVISIEPTMTNEDGYLEVELAITIATRYENKGEKEYEIAF